MNKQSQSQNAGAAGGKFVDWSLKDQRQDATGNKPLMRNPKSRSGIMTGCILLGALCVLAVLLTGCHVSLGKIGGDW